MAADKSCTGDCLRCSMQQQIYCSSQRTYAMLENHRAFAARLEDIEKRLEQLASPVNLIPLNGEAQSSGGAEE